MSIDEQGKARQVGLKSSYDLVMERLARAGDAPGSLSDKQKAELAEIESVARAKIAELEILYADKMRAAAGDVEKVAALHEELKARTAKAREEAEVRKEQVRKGEGS